MFQNVGGVDSGTAYPPLVTRARGVSIPRAHSPHPPAALTGLTRVALMWDMVTPGPGGLQIIECSQSVMRCRRGLGGVETRWRAP